ncbi:MAG: metalloregulator ArsR/SmtB family transcription factor [Rhodobacterales bacterium]
MDINSAISAFATLGHAGRLSVFRLLMRHAPQAVRPTEIAAALDLKQNTLSHHLSDLERAGLIRSERQGRSLFYSVDLPHAGSLVTYLVEDCCRGRPDICIGLPHAAPDQRLPLKGQQMRLFNVLFVCTSNSARSIFAEALLHDLGQGRFRAYSAGTDPRGVPHPRAMDMLARAGLPTEGLRSKHLAEFEGADAPQMDFVFTVCDRAASEECPPWPGHPLSAHWGIADPVKATGTEAEQALAFAEAFDALRRRIAAFVALPLAELDKITLQKKIDDIGCDTVEKGGVA